PKVRIRYVRATRPRLGEGFRAQSRLTGPRGLPATVAIVHRETDGRAPLAVDLDVGEGRHAHQVDLGRREEPAGDGDCLDGLVEGPRPDDLHVDRPALANRAGYRTCHRVGVRLARHLELHHASPDDTRVPLRRFECEAAGPFVVARRRSVEGDGLVVVRAEPVGRGDRLRLAA